MTITIQKIFDMHPYTAQNWTTNNRYLNRRLWPSGLRLHAISQLIVATEGPGFESPLGSNNIDRSEVEIQNIFIDTLK